MSMVISARVSVLTATFRPAKTAVLKEAMAEVTVYVPGGSALKRKFPEPSVLTVRVSSVSRLLMVTVAAGTTAPDASVIVPRTTPAPYCANKDVVNMHSATKSIRMDATPTKTKYGLGVYHNFFVAYHEFGMSEQYAP
jgi:hypothetical protein